MTWVNLDEIYIPKTGGDIEGDLAVSGGLNVNDGLGTDTTYNVAEEITNLKEAWDSVSQTHTDTGWVTLNDYIKYRLKNGIVTITGKVANSKDIGGKTWHEIGVMPEGLRPEVQINFCFNGQGADTANISAVVVPVGDTGGTPGAVNLYTTADSLKYWAFTVNYPVD